jgi:HPt (histidine-containing phosphotransfer) domain-containing protein
MPVLDTTAIERLRKLGGNALLARMIDLFFEIAPKRVQAAADAAAAHDLHAVERAAHSLKSSAGNLGAERLRHVAEQLEAAAAQADDTAVTELVLRLREALDEAATQLLELKKGMPT